MLRRLTRADRVRVLLTEAARLLESMKEQDEAREDEIEFPTAPIALRDVEHALEAIENGILSGEF